MDVVLSGFADFNCRNDCRLVNRHIADCDVNSGADVNIYP